MSNPITTSLLMEKLLIGLMKACKQPYTDFKKLGSGGFGAAYRVKNTNNNKYEVMKIVAIGGDEESNK